MSECNCKERAREAVKFLARARENRRNRPDDIVASGCLRDALEDVHDTLIAYAECQLCGIQHTETCDMGVDCTCQDT